MKLKKPEERTGKTACTALQEVLQPRFALILLEGWLQRGGPGLAFRITVFRGGKPAAHLSWSGRRDRIPAAVVGEMSRLLSGAARATSLVVGVGSGWRWVIESVRPEAAISGKAVDLRRAAAALFPGLSPAAALPVLAERLGVAGYGLEQEPGGSLAEDVLWRVLAEADRRLMSVSSLAEAAAGAAAGPQPEKYDFAFEELRRIPASPGVYIFRDREDRVLYVGKSANLARRFREYFTRRWNPPEKLRVIWDRIARFSVLPAGSELEALLLEQRTIAELHPQLNVMRRISERPGRYGAPPLPVAVLERSVCPDAVEVFFLGRGRAFQVRFFPGRRPPVGLLRVIRWVQGKGGAVRRTRAVRDWGAVGEALGCRYFGAHCGRLHWLEVEGGVSAAEMAERLRAAAQAMLAGAPPGPYRDLTSGRPPRSAASRLPPGG